MLDTTSMWPGMAKRRSRRVGIAAGLILIVVSTFLVTAPTPADATGSSTWIVVDVDDAKISGEGWNPSPILTITVDTPGTTAHPDVTRQVTLGSNQHSFVEYVGNERPIWQGDIVTVTDGTTVRSHRVTSIFAIDSDESADTVSGMAEPGATVAAVVTGAWNTSLLTSADGSGLWTFDYAGVWNLKSGTIVQVREFDTDGDSTRIDVTLPVPPDFDSDGIRNIVDNCLWSPNATQYDGDGDGIGTMCDEVDRVSGANRYATAAAVAEMAFDEADTVFLAPGSNFPDALVAAAAGGPKAAPVLLTRSGSLPAETITELVRLHPGTVYIVGGTAVISPAVEQELHAYVPKVTRLAGAERYGTAAAVSAEVFPSKSYTFIALGTNFPDALVAAAAAGEWGSPVLLTRRDHLPQATLLALAARESTKIFVVGGPAAISDTVVEELKAYGPVERIWGADRYATAAAISDRFFAMSSNAFLAYGGDFPDALVAAAAGGHTLAPVLLVDHDTIPAPTRSSMDRLATGGRWIVGGTAVIGDDVYQTLP